MKDGIVIVAGMGEVGRPLFNLLNRVYQCVGIDIQPSEIQQPCDVFHVCYPFQIPDFVGTTVSYIEKYKPTLTIINSTIGVGTSRTVQDRVSSPIVYSPVRGKHANMEQEMLQYKKFVAGFDLQSITLATEHFAHAGFPIDTFRTPEIAELSKLMETTWFGVLIGWAQEVERFAARCGGSYEEVNKFMKEVAYLPSNIFPGHIGGHCVMPNIAILLEQFQSNFLNAVVDSNDAKAIEGERSPLRNVRKAVEESAGVSASMRQPPCAQSSDIITVL